MKENRIIEPTNVGKRMVSEFYGITNSEIDFWCNASSKQIKEKLAKII